MLLLIFIAIPCAAVQITEFCPDTYLPEDADEYLVLSGVGSLDGVVISDGEGGFRFPTGASIDGEIIIASHGTAYQAVHGTPPRYEWYDTSPFIEDVIRSGTLKLANKGDQLSLYHDQNRLVQTVSWPEDVTAREGQVHYYDGTWDPRVLMLGQSRVLPVTCEGVRGTVFAAPDSSFSVFSDCVAGASSRILVNVYEFTSPRMASLLGEARDRGVSVEVLLEGGPVGGISREEQGVIFSLNQSGIPVYLMTGEQEAHPPYRFDHAKYMVVDESRVFITSENFKDHGFPVPVARGNRGWGAVLESRELAEYFSGIFYHDSRGAWVDPASPADPGLPEDPVENSRYSPEFEPYGFDSARVTTVISPDSSGLISDLIRSAEDRIDIEQAYITDRSPGQLNPYLAEAINASRRGVRVRVILDSSWYNVAEDTDNDEMVSNINRIAVEEALPLQARLADLEGNNLMQVHNKGVIVDGRKVLISSINWNENSPTFNREAGVIIEHPGVGAYFSEVFEDDWNSGRVETGGTPRPDYLKVGLAFAVLAVLAVYFTLRRRRVR
nr:phospholipase D-like domain-containing protein [Methanolinea mesophila]